MASIKKRSNGTFQAAVFVGRDANGKQLFKYITRKSERECIAAAREMEQEIYEGRYSNMGNMRFSAWADKWLKLNEKRLSPSTYCSYKIYVETHYKPFFKTMKLSKIKDLHILEYQNEKLETLSSTTVRKHMLVLRKMLRDALKQKSPAENVTICSANEYMPHVITKEEFHRIHEAAKGTRDEIIILLAGWCGLRRGEIFALKWNDVEWDNLTIRVDESRTLSEDGYVDGKVKSRNGYRVIAAPEYLINLLDKYRKSIGKIQKRIFMDNPNNYTDHFKHFLSANKLPRVRFHDLRHYHASYLYENKIPDIYAAERLGHDIRVLKSIYQHLGLDKLKELDEHIKKLGPTS